MAELIDLGNIGDLLSDTELLALAASEEEHNRRASSYSSCEPIGERKGGDSSLPQKGMLARMNVDLGDGRSGNGPGDEKVDIEEGHEDMLLLKIL